jgi:hypothetical protein
MVASQIGTSLRDRSQQIIVPVKTLWEAIRFRHAKVLSALLARPADFLNALITTQQGRLPETIQKLLLAVKRLNR